jgi:hypothetical protein
MATSQSTQTRSQVNGMSKELVPSERRAVARPLAVLVPLIRTELRQGATAALEYYREAGVLLIEAKRQLRHGEWSGWLKDNFHLSARTARTYMQAAEARQNGSARRFRTLSDVVQPAREPHHRPAWYTPVQEATNRVNPERLAQEAQNRGKERQLLRELGLRVIKIGYRALSARLHPDKGGSSEAMARLNRVCDLLKKAL